MVSRQSVLRDKAYIASRVKHEGFSFLTKTLPKFFKGILVGLEKGAYIPVPGFNTRPRSLLPAFLQGWTKRIFAPSGELLPDADVYSISELHQICNLLYKLEVPCTSAENQRVIDSFIQNEFEIATEVQENLDFDNGRFRLARKLVNDLFRGFNPRNIRPRHGPGAVAGGEKGNGKYSFGTKYQRLHSKYPYYEYFSPSLSRRSFELPWYKSLTPSVLPIAKVVLVPKDSRGPRLISMEPLEIQWIQQGLSRLVISRVYESNLTKGKVNFDDQTVNQRLALSSSRDGKYATIDLKDASDRISLRLVRELFPEDLVEHMEACRSIATTLPCGKVVPLNKFAPMGSALCFPVLALTVWALAEATCRLNRITGEVYVYGDDLIVPTCVAPLVLDTLESYGLAINHGKSFLNGKFRESCGQDAYDGVSITPIRFKKGIYGEHPSHTVYSHLIELSEAFFNKGYWATCEFLRKKVQQDFGPVPWTHSRSFPGFYCPDYSETLLRNKSFKRRHNADYQRTELRVPRVVTPTEFSSVDYTAWMLKGLNGLYRMCAESGKVALRRRGALHKRWCVV